MIRFLMFFLFLSQTLFSQQSQYYQLSAEAFSKLPQIQMPINPVAPDYELLDAAIFHQTNLMRKKYGLPAFKLGEGLYRAARNHSEAMINKDFYDHQNPYNKSLRNLDDRVEQFDRRYFELAENIAEIDLIDTPNDFCPERMSNGEYRYMDCRTHRPYKMMSYWTFAEEALRLWMDSKPHRRNILHPEMRLIGCAVQICKRPYATEEGPFARLTQDFASEPLPE